MTEQVCYRCGSNRIMSVSADCRDTCYVRLDDEDYEGYIPSNINIGDKFGDNIDLEVCANCGQMVGIWPLPYRAHIIDSSANVCTYTSDHRSEDNLHHLITVTPTKTALVKPNIPTLFSQTFMPCLTHDIMQVPQDIKFTTPDVLTTPSVPNLNNQLNESSVIEPLILDEPIISQVDLDNSDQQRNIPDEAKLLNLAIKTHLNNNISNAYRKFSSYESSYQNVISHIINMSELHLDCLVSEEKEIPGLIDISDQHIYVYL